MRLAMGHGPWNLAPIGWGDIFSIGLPVAIPGESMEAGHRRLTTLLLLLAVAIGGEAAAQRPSAAPASPPSSGPQFSGMVLIAGLPADPGTVVQVVVFRSGQSFKVCGEGTVQVQTAGLTRPPPVPNTTGYEATLEDTPECVNPDNTYDFYVNGVQAAASRKYPFSPNNQLATVHLSVPEVALKTGPSQEGVRLVWFYGRVRDAFGRPAPAGTTVTAKARGASCGGSGKTEDLYWAPKATNRQTIGVLGFYWIGIERTAECLDRSVRFDIYAGSKLLRAVTVNVSTPPYGRALSANVQMP